MRLAVRTGAIASLGVATTSPRNHESAHPRVPAHGADGGPFIGSGRNSSRSKPNLCNEQRLNDSKAPSAGATLRHWRPNDSCSLQVNWYSVAKVGSYSRGLMGTNQDLRAAPWAEAAMGVTRWESQHVHVPMRQGPRSIRRGRREVRGVPRLPCGLPPAHGFIRWLAAQPHTDALVAGTPARVPADRPEGDPCTVRRRYRTSTANNSHCTTTSAQMSDPLPMRIRS